MISLGIFGGQLAVSELILFMLFLTDILMLGVIGEQALAAALLVNACIVLCFVTALGFLQGALPLAAGRLEKQDQPGFHGVIAASLVMASGCSLLIVTIFLLFIPTLGFLGYPADLLTECWAYIAGILPALTAMPFYIAIRNAIIATGNSRGFIEISLISLVVNALFNYILGFGVEWGPFQVPAMGIFGIGVSSSIVELSLAGAFIFLLHRRGFRLHHLGGSLAMRQIWQRVRPHMTQTMKIGLAVALIFFVDSTLFSGVLIMVGRHDIQGMAALALIFEWVALAVMIPVGISEAVVQRVAQAQSNIDADPATRQNLNLIMKAAFWVTALYMMVVGFVFFGLDINVPTLFIMNNEAHPELVTRLELYAVPGFVTAVLMGFIIVFAALLRGLLDVNTSMVAVVVCYWGIGLGATFLFVEMMDYGAYAALGAVTVALAAATATLVVRLRLRLFGNSAS